MGENGIRIQVEEVSTERLCEAKSILTANKQFPGPTLYAEAGQILIIDVENKGKDNITMYCCRRWGRHLSSEEWLVEPGNAVRQNITLSEKLEGTLWWHAVSPWQSATVHGALVVYPKPGPPHLFPHLHANIPIILGEWWKNDVILQHGSNIIMNSDALTINGQPGDFYPCSKNGTFKIIVETGKTYLLRIVNTALGKTLVFGIANHSLTVVAVDGRPLQIPFTRDYVQINVKQTMDCILEAILKPDYYYMAARDHISNATTTAIVQYRGDYVPSSPPALPYLPSYYHQMTSSTDGQTKTSYTYLAIIFLILALFASCAGITVLYRNIAWHNRASRSIISTSAVAPQF